MELLIALILTTIIAVSIFSLDLFSRYHVITTDKRVRVQNQVANIMEHISKKAINAIGGALTAEGSPLQVNGTTLMMYIDRATGGGSGDGQRGTGGDAWVAYRYRNSTATSGEQYRVEYCNSYNNASASCSTNWEVIGKNIYSFSPATQANDTYLSVNITACWDPSEPDPVYKKCGTADNPAISMKSRFHLPSVSRN